MTGETINFGIDLGTTNSSIAVFNGSGADVFKNNEGQEYTPSAVWIDGKGKLYVGRLAKERLEDDNENTFSEFKLQMGTDQLYRFARSGRQMRPEELSAEVLKSLRGDVQQRTGEEVIAAVISVPAAFELPQTNATNKAAQLAGLECNQLVQEPVAAAIAYGFQTKSNSVFWMVYDLGGGTFDVAIIQVRDGQIKIENHKGNNQLGGKLIDWDIVERLFVPALLKDYQLSDFNRGNRRWKAAFAKLKLHAENAKIQLSRATTTGVYIDPLCQDDRGTWIRFEYELKRGEIEPIIEPLVERSINLCNETLEESNLASGDMEKVILVGGPTLTPIVRDMLSNKLRIPLEFSKDPLTVNAQGAAIFAGGVRMPREILKKNRVVAAGQYGLELEYKPIGNDTEPLVGGKVIGAEGESLAGFTVEIMEAKTHWRSGKINLSAEGIFTAVLHAGERNNEFLIELRDGAGNILQTVPERFTYTIGVDVPVQPLINSVGIALANAEMFIFLHKGTPLPARRREKLRTTRELKKGATGELLRIPVVEGEITRRADRNRLIGALEINSSTVRRDVPLGSEVEVTIDIDDSRLVHTKAYVPVLDEEFEGVLVFDGTPASPQQLAEDFEREKGRLEKAREAARKAGIDQSNKGLGRIQDEGMVHEIETTLAAARVDPDAAEKCRKRLLDLEIATDEVEEAVKWPALVAAAEQNIVDTRKVVDDFGEKDDRTDFNSLERETRAAIAARDGELLQQKIDQLNSLYWRVALSQGGTWVALYRQIENNKSELRDPALAAQLFAQGRRAIDNNDIESLKSIVRQLYALRPGPPPPWVKEGYDSHIQ
jgi:molecular chaperone DnaK